MSTTPPDRLLKLFEAGDLEELDQYLSGLGPDERTVVRRWFQNGRPWFRDTANDFESAWQPNRGWVLPWCEAIGVVALLGPVTAARRVPWANLYTYASTAGDKIMLGRLRNVDTDWAAAFVDAAAAVPLSRDRYAHHRLTRWLRDTVIHHGLPCPSGTTFLLTWLTGSVDHTDESAQYPQTAEEVTDALRQDRLMPDLLWHYLGSGHCGDTPNLPAAVAVLLAEGRLDRDRLVETVLTQLTTLPRVATQRVLVQLLVAAELTPAEIPGGLDYLLGVIATAHGSVGKVLLPYAIDLARDGELTHLAEMIAARPERAQKDLLLRRLRDRAEADGVLEALTALAGGDEDAAFTARVQRVIDRHSVSEAPPTTTRGDSLEPPTLLGLWDQRPAPAEPASEHWARHRMALLQNAWSVLLGRAADPMNTERAWATTETLGALADGEDPTVPAEVVIRMLGNDTVSFPRTSQAFEDLFLGGAMSLLWAPALAVADAACRRQPRPARLDFFLRMLARYAAEAPQQELPLQIAGFAAAPGQSKAQTEARTLGAVLSGETPDGYLARIRAAGTTRTAHRPHARPSGRNVGSTNGRRPNSCRHFRTSGRGP